MLRTALPITLAGRFSPFGPLGVRAKPHERSGETQQLGVLRAMPAAGEEIPDLDVGHLAARRLIGLVPDEQAPCGGVAG
jgi:plasmid stability protein